MMMSAEAMDMLQELDAEDTKFLHKLFDCASIGIGEQ